MLENGHIGLRQFTILIILFTIGSSILIVPSGLAAVAKQDAWASAILGVMIGITFTWFYNKLGQRFPNKTLIEFSELILGKWLGKAVSLLYIFHFALLAALVLRNIGDFMTTQIMPETPIQIIHILFLLVVIMGSRLGIETLARAGEILFPWVIVLFVFMIVFISPNMKLEKLQPLFENGIQPVIAATIPFLGTPFMELIIFLMIFPYVIKHQKAKTAYWVGALIGGLFLIIVCTVTILVLGPAITAHNNYPSYSLAKKINVGDFLTRVEAMMAGIWFISIFMKVAICFYASTLGLAQTLNLRDHRTLSLPMGMIIVVMSLISYPNIVYFQEFVSTVWAPYSAVFGIGLPMLMLVVAILRKKKEPDQEDKQQQSSGEQEESAS